MLNFSTSALMDADVLLYVTDVVETPDKHNDFVEKVGHLGVPVLLLINKIDLSNQEKLVELVEAWKELLPKAEIIPILCYFEIQCGLCDEAGEGTFCPIRLLILIKTNGRTNRHVSL